MRLRGHSFWLLCTLVITLFPFARPVNAQGATRILGVRRIFKTTPATGDSIDKNHPASYINVTLTDLGAALPLFKEKDFPNIAALEAKLQASLTESIRYCAPPRAQQEQFLTSRYFVDRYLRAAYLEPVRRAGLKDEEKKKRLLARALNALLLSKDERVFGKSPTGDNSFYTPLKGISLLLPVLTHPFASQAASKSQAHNIASSEFLETLRRRSLLEDMYNQPADNQTPDRLSLSLKPSSIRTTVSEAGKKAVTRLDQLSQKGETFFDQLSQISVDMKGLRSEPDPRNLLFFSFQERTGDGATDYLPEWTVSTLEGVDLSIQGIQGSDQGYGIGLRYDPFARPLYRHLEAYQEALRQMQTSNRTASTAKEQVTVPVFDKALREGEMAAEGYAREVMRLRTSLVMGYRNLTGVGSLLNTGVSLSWMRPLHHGPSPGFNILANMQYVRFFPVESLRQDKMGRERYVTEAGRWGLALAWQDRIAHYDNPVGGLGHWTWRVGLEYNAANALGTTRFPLSDEPILPQHDTYDLFVRHRFARFYDVNLSVGKGPSGRAYVGFGISVAQKF